MLKVLTIKNNYVEGGKKLCDIYADSRNEVVAGANVNGLGDIALLATGSICITKDFDVGIKASDGTWNWA